MRTTPTWLTISMIAGVFSWGCYEHVQRKAAESTAAVASEACDNADDDNADDNADDDETTADAQDDDNDGDAQGVTIVEVTTGSQGSTRVVRIQ
jgi:hypothetical protein